MNAILRTFRPIRRRGTVVPPAQRRSAARLARKIGNKHTAYLFAVSTSAVDRWRHTYTD